MASAPIPKAFVLECSRIFPSSLTSNPSIPEGGTAFTSAAINNSSAFSRSCFATTCIPALATAKIIFASDSYFCNFSFELPLESSTISDASIGIAYFSPYFFAAD